MLFICTLKFYQKRTLMVNRTIPKKKQNSKHHQVIYLLKQLVKLKSKKKKHWWRVDKERERDPNSTTIRTNASIKNNG